MIVDGDSHDSYGRGGRDSHHDAYDGDDDDAYDDGYGDTYTDADTYDDDYDELDDLLGERTAPVRRAAGNGGGGADDTAGRGLGGTRSARRQATRRRRRTALPKLLAVLLVTAALLGGVIYGVGRLVGRLGEGESHADFTGPGEGGVVIQVADGATSREIAGVLAAAGVVASPGAFVDVAATDPQALSIQPGYYKLKLKMSAAGALQALLDPAANSVSRFTVPEGRTVRQVLEALSERTGVPVKEYQKVIDKPAPLGLPKYASTPEGYLFPSTYDLIPGASPAQTLKMFVDRFEHEVADLDLEHVAPKVGLTPQEVVTVASIIEKEVANPDEYAKVSRVIFNRLDDRTGHFTRLDMDSTTRYATGNYDSPLTMSQLEEQNPYNTRAVAGLPPGAIANPGRRALEAALHPARGTWLYFVALPRSGVTIFATTEAEWEQAQARYRAEGG